MAIAVVMPKFGLSMETGTVSLWLKREGERVKQGEPLVEITTDKINNEYESPESGVILKLLVQEGEEAPVSTPICFLGEPGEDIGSLTTGSTPQPKPVFEQPEILPAESSHTKPSEDRIKMSPVARRLAQEHGIDISSITGTGPAGRVQKEDVEEAIRQKKSGTADPQASTQKTPASEAAFVLRPLMPLRKAVAESVTESWSMPHFTVQARVKAVSMEKALLSMAQAGPRSIVALLAYYCSRLLVKYPGLNARFSRNGIMEFQSIHVAFAMGVQGGVLLPVIRDVQSKSLKEIATDCKRLKESIRSGKPDESIFEGGTFTISSLQGFDIQSFDAIIPPGQSAILAAGPIVREPWVEGNELCAAPVIHLALTADHRAVDGTDAASFLSELKAILEGKTVP